MKDIKIDKFLSLARRKEEIKEELKSLDEELDQVMTELGAETVFQDEATGLVYKLVVPTYTSVKMKHIDYVRTIDKSRDEKRGTLSKKEAEGYGFKVD
jgi:hypothetical protein